MEEEGQEETWDRPLEAVPDDPLSLLDQYIKPEWTAVTKHPQAASSRDTATSNRFQALDSQQPSSSMPQGRGGGRHNTQGGGSSQGGGRGTSDKRVSGTPGRGSLGAWCICPRPYLQYVGGTSWKGDRGNLTVPSDKLVIWKAHSTVSHHAAGPQDQAVKARNPPLTQCHAKDSSRRTARLPGILPTRATATGGGIDTADPRDTSDTSYDRGTSDTSDASEARDINDTSDAMNTPFEAGAVQPSHEKAWSVNVTSDTISNPQTVN